MSVSRIRDRLTSSSLTEGMYSTTPGDTSCSAVMLRLGFELTSSRTGFRSFMMRMSNPSTCPHTHTHMYIIITVGSVGALSQGSPSHAFFVMIKLKELISKHVKLTYTNFVLKHCPPLSIDTQIHVCMNAYIHTDTDTTHTPMYTHTHTYFPPPIWLCGGGGGGGRDDSTKWQNWCIIFSVNVMMHGYTVYPPPPPPAPSPPPKINLPPYPLA